MLSCSSTYSNQDIITGLANLAVSFRGRIVLCFQDAKGAQRVQCLKHGAHQLVHFLGGCDKSGTGLAWRSVHPNTDNDK